MAYTNVQKNIQSKYVYERGIVEGLVKKCQWDQDVLKNDLYLNCNCNLVTLFFHKITQNLRIQLLAEYLIFNHLIIIVNKNSQFEMFRATENSLYCFQNVIWREWYLPYHPWNGNVHDVSPQIGDRKFEKFTSFIAHKFCWNYDGC